MFLAIDMKICGRHNGSKHNEIRGSDNYFTLKKHKEIRGSDKYVTLDSSSKFDSLDKMKITSSESKGILERSGKGLITSLGFKTKPRSQKYKMQGMPSEISVRRTFLGLLRSLRKLRNRLMRRRGPNMSLLTATFI